MTQEGPKSLPVPGSTASTRDAKAPTTEALSVEEAAAAYGLSVSTVYRRLHRGEVPGAYKVQTAQGEAWRIPLGSLEAIGYHRAPEAEQAPAQATAAPESISEVVARLSAVIESSQRQLEAAEADRGASLKRQVELEVSAARSEAKLEIVEEQVAELKAEVERLRKRRRWFGRGGD